VANELILIVEDNPKNLKLVRDVVPSENLSLAIFLWCAALSAIRRS